jgi:hypothetical protein
VGLQATDAVEEGKGGGETRNLRDFRDSRVLSGIFLVPVVPVVPVVPAVDFLPPWSARDSEAVGTTGYAALTERTGGAGIAGLGTRTRLSHDSPRNLFEICGDQIPERLLVEGQPLDTSFHGSVLLERGQA